MIRWTLRFLAIFWLIHFGVYMLPGSKGITEAGQSVVECKDGYAIALDTEPHKGRFLPCTLFNQYYWLLEIEQDPSAASALLLNK